MLPPIPAPPVPVITNAPVVSLVLAVPAVASIRPASVETPVAPNVVNAPVLALAAPTVAPVFLS